jgi:hypothetical protein
LQVLCTCKISALNEKCTIGMLPSEVPQFGGFRGRFSL